jgi:hypothetical protein
MHFAANQLGFEWSPGRGRPGGNRKPRQKGR